MAKGGCNPEQLPRRDVQRDDLFAAGGDADHTDMTVQQQEKPLGHGTFLKDDNACIEPPWVRLIKDLADLVGAEPRERRKSGQKRGVELGLRRCRLFCAKKEAVGAGRAKAELMTTCLGW
jgi:hypothetical protein